MGLAAFFRCGYIVASAPLHLEVYDRASPSSARSVFNGLREDIAATLDRLTLGDEAFIAQDGRIIVRRDRDVLVVDPRRSPDEIGEPVTPRSVFTEDVVEALLACGQ